VRTILDLNAQQIVVDAVRADEHLGTLADVQRGIEPGVPHLIGGNDAAARQDREEAVDCIAIRDIAGQGEAIDAGQVGPMLEEALQRKARQ